LNERKKSAECWVLGAEFLKLKIENGKLKKPDREGCTASGFSVREPVGFRHADRAATSSFFNFQFSIFNSASQEVTR
jgi:hypothetical protein